MPERATAETAPLTVGLSLGARRARGDDGRAAGGATLGVLGSYNALARREQRLVLGTGLDLRQATYGGPAAGGATSGAGAPTDAAPAMIVRLLRSAASAAALLAASRGATAQVPPDAPTPTRAASVSPALIFSGSAAGDYEQRVSERLSLGVGAQYDGRHSVLFSGASGYDVDVSVKLRYYPDSPALDGLSVGVLAGGTRYQRARAGSPGVDGESQRTHSVPTVGFTLDYNHLLGADKHFLVGIGTGVKRRFVRGDDGFDRVTAVRPTVRLALGYAW